VIVAAKFDALERVVDVRFGSKADMCSAQADVRLNAHLDPPHVPLPNSDAAPALTKFEVSINLGGGGS
jgi:hypothetical protein